VHALIFFSAGKIQIVTDCIKTDRPRRQGESFMKILLEHFLVSSAEISEIAVHLSPLAVDHW
jgi:hypothetical protein